MTEKFTFADEAQVIAKELRLPIFATVGTAEMLREVGVGCTVVDKGPGEGLSAVSLIENGEIDMVINIPREYDSAGRPDGYLIRRAAIDFDVPLFTDLQLSRALIEALRRKRGDKFTPRALSEFIQEAVR